MKPLRVVIDTNVLVAGLRSRRGASFALLQKLGGRDFIPVSPPLCLEYEDVLARPGMIPGFSVVDAGDFVDYMVSVSEECRVYFLWRPWLPDPKDDLVLEVALAGGASHIVTHNIRDFAGADELSLAVVTPDQFLKLIPIPVSTLTVSLPESIHRRAETLAKSDGISFDQFVALALAEKVAVLDAGTYLAERAKHGDREKFERILARVPDIAPEKGDDLTP